MIHNVTLLANVRLIQLSLKGHVRMMKYGPGLRTTNQIVQENAGVVKSFIAKQTIKHVSRLE